MIEDRVPIRTNFGEGLTQLLDYSLCVERAEEAHDRVTRHHDVARCLCCWGQPDQKFDTLVRDAFSGDSIPIHLLTREALEFDSRHVKRRRWFLQVTQNRDHLLCFQRVTPICAYRSLPANTPVFPLGYPDNIHKIARNIRA